MATASFSSAPINTAVANFKTWAKGLSDALKTAGMLTLESDSGNIDWAGVVALPANDTDAGYEIYRFADSLQATDPVFMRINYGLAGGASKYCSVEIIVGTGWTNGGTITGAATTLTLTGGTTNATNYNSYVSSAGNRLQFFMFAGAATGVPVPLCFSIERLKDDAGADIAGGVNILGAWAATTYSQQFLPTTGAAFPTTPFTAPICAAPPVGNGQYGTKVGVYPVHPFLGYLANPNLGTLICFRADLTAAGSTISITMYGTAHTYMICDINSSKTINGNAAPNYIAPLMRYE